jgi:hypothetical protein
MGTGIVICEYFVCDRHPSLHIAVVITITTTTVLAIPHSYHLFYIQRQLLSSVVINYSYKYYRSSSLTIDLCFQTYHQPDLLNERSNCRSGGIKICCQRITFGSRYSVGRLVW